MTIEKALNYMPCLMEACSHCLVRGCDKSIEKIDEAKIVAIETMRKYQKIQAIAEKCNLKLLPKEGMSTFMKDVLEVLEDGNDK